MNHIEAMKQALEALRGSYGETRSWHRQIEAAMATLRTAIEAAEKQEPVAWAKQSEKKLRITHMNMQGVDGWRPLGYSDTTPPNVATSLAAPVQEPDWRDAEAISNLPAVDEAIRALLEDQTADNATAVVRAVLEANPPAAPNCSPFANSEQTVTIDRACFERGCACFNPSIDKDAVIVEKRS